MTTHTILASRFSEAVAKVVAETGITMFPKRGESFGVWEYNMSEETDLSALTKSPLFTMDEVNEMAKLCLWNFYDPFLWQMLLALIQQLPNQERFRAATYLQPQVLASTFYWQTIKHSMRN